MERSGSKKESSNLRILPENYTVPQLKGMPEEELRHLCEEQSLSYRAVCIALSKSESIPTQRSTEIPNPEKKLHPDYLFIQYLKKQAEGGKVGLEKHGYASLENIERKSEEYTQEIYDKASTLVDQIENASHAERSSLISRSIALFTEFFLQKGLVRYDEERKSFGGDKVHDIARNRAFLHLATTYNLRDNVWQRVRGLRDAMTYFGANLSSSEEILYELRQLLDRYEGGEANNDDVKMLNGLLRAIKGNYYGATNPPDPGIFRVLLPGLVEQYRKMHDPNRLSPATLQGGAVYSVGEYFGNSYVKNPRPRRYDDELGHTG